jgi:hypothetical protein
MLLRALIREEEGAALMQRAQIEASILPVVMPNQRQATLRNAMGLMLQGQALREMHTITKVRTLDLKEDDKRQIRTMAAGLKVLKATDFYRKMTDILAAS